MGLACTPSLLPTVWVRLGCVSPLAQCVLGDCYHLLLAQLYSSVTAHRWFVFILVVQLVLVASLLLVALDGLYLQLVSKKSCH